MHLQCVLGEKRVIMGPKQLIAVALFMLHLVSSVTKVTGAEEAEKTAPADDKDAMTPELMFQRLFKHKRAAHLEAVKGVVELGKYEKQYKMVALLTEKIVKIIGGSKILLMESGFTPGDSLPKDEKLRDAYSQILENLAFMGDILLRLPDITHDVLKRNQENLLVIKWAVSFCNETKTYQGNDGKLLHLMAQELGILEKDENYVNPYKEDTVLKKMAEDAANEVIAEAVKKAKKKNDKKNKAKKQRGPRLRGEL